MVLPKDHLHPLSITVTPASIAQVDARAIVPTALKTIVQLHAAMSTTRITAIPQFHTMAVVQINL